MGQHKDMFRTDIFVGRSVPNHGNSYNDDTAAIRYVISETEVHPTPLRGFETVFEEAGRLWLAGYYLLSRNRSGGTGSGSSSNDLVLSVVPNTEVPRGYPQGV